MAEHDWNPIKIFLWFLPRTISTAFTKCLSGIEGMEIWFERFTHTKMVQKQYELASGEEMPMEYEGNEDKVQEAAALFERLTGSKVEADRVVYGNVRKDMEASTSRYILAKEAFFILLDEKSRQHLPPGFRHVFIIRHPCSVLGSHKKAIIGHLKNLGIHKFEAVDENAFDIVKDDPLMNAEKFFSGMHEAWKYIRANVDPNPIVIDSDDLLTNPAEVLSKFCKLTDLPYSDSLLRWNASPDIIKTWKTSSKDVLQLSVAFYETAMYSSEFLPPKPPISLERLTPDVRRIAEASMPYYQEMIKFKI